MEISLFSYCRDNSADFYTDAESPTTCQCGLNAVLLGVCSCMKREYHIQVQVV